MCICVIGRKILIDGIVFILWHYLCDYLYLQFKRYCSSFFFIGTFSRHHTFYTLKIVLFVLYLIITKMCKAVRSQSIRATPSPICVKLLKLNTLLSSMYQFVTTRKKQLKPNLYNLSQAYINCIQV